MKKIFKIFKNKVKTEDDLLVIKQKDINSVPIVIYNGKEIELKQHIFFEWNTQDCEINHGSNFNVQYFDYKKDGKSQVVREGFSDPMYKSKLLKGVIHATDLHTIAEDEQTEFIMPINNK